MRKTITTTFFSLRSPVLGLVFLFTFHFSPFISIAQTPSQVIQKVNKNFSKVSNYSCDMLIHTDISFIKMNDIKAKIFFKRPNKFKIKAEGILLLPKQNPNYMFAMLSDTASYTAFKSGNEMVNGVNCSIINVLPLKDTADLILGKFWIDEARGIILKSNLTTRSNGTVLIEHFYGTNAQYALADKLIFTIETSKFKIPKALVADLNSDSDDDNKSDAENKTSKITLTFSNYLVNKGVDDAVFK
ncbi:MAG TPA: hypothetical protein DCQ93_07665 [Bacteroidetes bacterium]|nr:hypothetical protein [Bacteroidota bacterium]